MHVYNYHPQISPEFKPKFFMPKSNMDAKSLPSWKVGIARAKKKLGRIIIRGGTPLAT